MEIRSDLHQESLITKTFDEGTESINTQSILEPAQFTDTDNDESELTLEERLLQRTILKNLLTNRTPMQAIRRSTVTRVEDPDLMYSDF